MLVTLHKISGVHFCLPGTNGFRGRVKIERFTAAGSRCRPEPRIENLSNHDDDGNKNVTNLHI